MNSIDWAVAFNTGYILAGIIAIIGGLIAIFAKKARG